MRTRKTQRRTPPGRQLALRPLPERQLGLAQGALCLRSLRRDHHTQVCNRCQKPRPENLAPREGRGRGFNERDDASDRRAPPPDEDDGYDDFGRRKKAKKSKAAREARR